MINKIIRVLQLFEKFGLHTFSLLVLPKLNKPIFIKTKNGQKISLNFDKATYYHLIHSLPKLEHLVDTLPSVLEGPIIDGGANIGLFASLLSERFPNNTIYSFEPSTTVLPLLQSNTNGKNIRVVPKGLSEQSGLLKFYSSLESDQIGSIEAESVATFVQKDKIIETEIEVTSLVDFVKQNKIEKISLIKLDVQGHELKILRSAVELFKITDYLILEVAFSDEDSIALLDFITQYFPKRKAINTVSFGADILFSK